MIYIIEDRVERQKQYLRNASLLDRSEIINDSKIISKTDLGKNEILDSIFKNASMIFVHRSYFEDESTGALSISKLASFKSNFRLKKIPVIFFSGGIEHGYLFENGLFGQINSKLFYSNLENAFIPMLDKLNPLKTSEWPKIELIIFGNQYRVHYFAQFISAIKSKIFPFKNTSEIDIEMKYLLEEIADSYLTEISLSNLKDEFLQIISQNNAKIEDIHSFCESTLTKLIQ